jgi:hypothetical protein
MYYPLILLEGLIKTKKMSVRTDGLQVWKPEPPGYQARAATNPSTAAFGMTVLVFDVINLYNRDGVIK